MKLKLELTDVSLDDLQALVNALSSSQSLPIDADVSEQVQPVQQPVQPVQQPVQPVQQPVQPVQKSVDIVRVVPEEISRPEFVGQKAAPPNVDFNSYAEAQKAVELLVGKQAALDFLQAVRDGGSVADVANKHTSTIKQVILSEVRRRCKTTTTDQVPQNPLEARERNAIISEISTLTGDGKEHIAHALKDYSIEELRLELEEQRKAARVTPVEDDVGEVDAVYVDNSALQPKDETFIAGSDMNNLPDGLFKETSLQEVYYLVLEHTGHDIDDAKAIIMDNRGAIPAMEKLSRFGDSVLESLIIRGLNQALATLNDGA